MLNNNDGNSQIMNYTNLQPIIHKLQSTDVLTDAVNCVIIKHGDINVQLMRIVGRKFIYMLCMDNIICYIGRTRNLYDRLTHHKMYKEFAEVMLIEFTCDDRMAVIERRLVQMLQPVLNKCWVKYGNKNNKRRLNTNLEQ